VEARAHTHDFPGLIYFERSAGALTFRGRETLIHAGDVYLIGPNAVVDVVGDPEGLVQARGSAVFFTPDALEAFGAVGSELAWRTHRLLRVFARDNADVVHLIHIPPGRRVGYPNPTYFSRVFGRAHEQTPGAWRRASAPGSG